VLREQVDELRRRLDDLGAQGGEPTGLPRVPFAELSGVHFARLVLLEDEADPDGQVIPATLLLMSEIDAPLDRHLRELAEIGGAGLDAVFGLCDGYPAEAGPGPRASFLRERMLPAQAAYVNTIGRTVEQIRREESLRRAIGDFLDAGGARSGEDPQVVRADIQRFVRGEPSLAWARRRAPRPSLRWRAGELVHAVAGAGALVICTPLLVLILPVWLAVLRLHERAEEAPHLRPDPEHARCLAALEDHVAQNPFSALGPIKPGPFRRTTLRAVLWLIDYGSRHVFTRNDLAGVKTIHFARWLVLDDWSRAIFTSYYDGSLESYMDDFIDKVAFGLNASFSNGIGYPRTRFLLFQGAKREEEFKDFLRRRQIPTQVWYSAYEQLSAHNIENNALIRSGLFGPLAAAEAKAWLQRL